MTNKPRDYILIALLTIVVIILTIFSKNILVYFFTLQAEERYGWLTEDRNSIKGIAIRTYYRKNQDKLLRRVFQIIGSTVGGTSDPNLQAYKKSVFGIGQRDGLCSWYIYYCSNGEKVGKSNYWTLGSSSYDNEIIGMLDAFCDIFENVNYIMHDDGSFMVKYFGQKDVDVGSDYAPMKFEKKSFFV